MCRSSCRSFNLPADLHIYPLTCGFVPLTPPVPVPIFHLAPSSQAVAESRAPRGAPWESRKADWAHFAGRLGSATSCSVGEAREAPKPNERGYLTGTRLLRSGGYLEQLGPERPKVAGGNGRFGGRTHGEPEVPRVLSIPRPCPVLGRSAPVSAPRKQPAETLPQPLGSPVRTGQWTQWVR